MLFINPNSKVNRNIPNLSLAYAATFFNAKVIDENTMSYTENRFLNTETDILGISIQSRTLNESEKIKNLYLKKYPKTQVKSIMTDIDIQCCYPYKEWEENLKFEKTFGDEFPFPNYELFDSFSVFKKNWQTGDWKYAIMTSLGCPFSCVYCMCKNRRWKSRSAENCFQELKIAKEKWDIKGFKIMDDCFNFDEARAIEFCNLIKPLNLTWSCANGVRADRLSEKMAYAMSESGCAEVSFGIESSDPEILKNIKKGETISQISEAIDIAKKYFKNINGYFIIGLPGSSYEKDLESLRWAKEKGINAHFSYHVPFSVENASDALFYGEGAKPMSDDYPKKLQKKIYKMTEAMRPGKRQNLFKKLVKKSAKIIFR